MPLRQYVGYVGKTAKHVWLILRWEQVTYLVYGVGTDKCSQKSPPVNYFLDFPLHRVQGLVFMGLNALTKALIEEHRWSHMKAIECVQSFLREARVQSHSVAEYDARLALSMPFAAHLAPFAEAPNPNCPCG